MSQHGTSYLWRSGYRPAEQNTDALLFAGANEHYIIQDQCFQAAQLIHFSNVCTRLMNFIQDNRSTNHLIKHATVANSLHIGYYGRFQQFANINTAELVINI